MNDIKESIDKVFALNDHLVEEKERLDTIIIGIESEIEQFLQNQETLHEAWESLRTLLEKLSEESIELLREMLNKGIKFIFHDRDYEIKTEVTDNVKKSMRLFLLEERDGEVIEAVIPEGIGGGVLVVISFIFRVFLVRLYNKRSFILLDESFTQLSSAYIPNFMEFIQHLINDMGFTFLWISHDGRVLPYFDKVYNVNMGKLKLLS